VWRPDGKSGAHTIDLGLQRDSHQLRTTVFNTSNWLSGSPTSSFSSFQGNTLLQSAYAQDAWRFADTWRTTLGLRVEKWQAENGVINGVTLPDRTETFVSPKAAIAYQATDRWTLRASVGRAVRNPTVSELYQGSTVAGAVVNNDPDLKAERSYTGELTAERELTSGRLRATAFHEDTRDALYSQAALAAGGGTVNTVQNVDHIRTSGVELVYQAADLLIAGFDLTSSVTYAHSRIVENRNFLASVGKWQPRVPDWRANLLGTYRLDDKWLFSLGTRYSGRQYNTLDNGV